MGKIYREVRYNMPMFYNILDFRFMITSNTQFFVNNYAKFII